MTSPQQSLPPARRCLPKAEFHAWLVRAEPGEQLEYHRGSLIWDRSPASELTEEERRAVNKIADAAFEAAGKRLVHLVQRRNAPFEFSYLAIKAPPVANMPSIRALIMNAQAQRSTPCLEIV